MTQAARIQHCRHRPPTRQPPNLEPPTTGRNRWSRNNRITFTVSNVGHSFTLSLLTNAGIDIGNDGGDVCDSLRFFFACRSFRCAPLIVDCTSDPGSAMVIVSGCVTD